MSAVQTFLKPFMLLDLEAFDNGLLTTVSPPALIVYLCLRRYVCRQEDDEFGKEFYGKKKLACLLKITSLCEKVRMKKRGVLYLLKELEEVGWIQRKRFQKRAAVLLGKWVRAGDQRAEFFFIDSELAKKSQVHGGAPIRVHGGALEKSKKAVIVDSDYLTSDNRKTPLIDNLLIPNRNPKIPSEERKPLTPLADGKKSPVPTAWSKSEDNPPTPLRHNARVPAHKPKTPTTKKSGPYELHKIFADKYETKYGVAPTVTPRDFKHCKEFLSWWGEDKAIKTLNFAVSNWDRLKIKLKTQADLPTIPLIYYHRDIIHFLTFQPDPWKAQGTKPQGEVKSKKGW